MANGSTISQKPVPLVEVLDRVLHKGAVIAGEIEISVAGIDLIRLGLQLVLASSDTLLEGEVSRLATLDEDENTIR
jgi:hypothetical protein